MTRHSGASGKPAKSRRPKASKSKSRSPAKVAGSRWSRTGVETEVIQLRRELHEARGEQTATAEVLRVISGSPGDLKPVFASMLENAVRICSATFGNIYRWDGEAGHLIATHLIPAGFAEERARSPDWRPVPNSPVGRMLTSKSVVHVANLATEEAYIEQLDPVIVAAVELGGARTVLFVPILKGSDLVGFFAVARRDIRPFTGKQIELVQNFAAQAVIAIENARLLNELRQRTTDLTERTTDLTEALERQTATSQVLQVISSSPGDLEPVFAAMLENAVRICDATFGSIYRWDGEALHLLATHNTPPAFAEVIRHSPFRPHPQSPPGRMVADKTVVHVADVRAEPAYIHDPVAVAAATLGGTRTALGVPLLHKGEMIGAFFLSRQEVHAFTDKQIELVKNFAAQAVIAIENARLLNELRQRTDALSEALEQQTATSEVLQTISSSPGDLEPVFATMLQKAVRICDAKFGNIYRWDGEVFHVVAMHNTPPAFAELRRRTPYRPNEGYIGRMVTTKSVVHIVDAAPRGLSPLRRSQTGPNPD